jgi:hypothetical protein
MTTLQEQRGRAVGGFDHLEAVGLEHRSHDAPDGIVVVDHEHHWPAIPTGLGGHLSKDSTLASPVR